jgi:hypothetical protein
MPSTRYMSRRTYWVHQQQLHTVTTLQPTYATAMQEHSQHQMKQRRHQLQREHQHETAEHGTAKITAAAAAAVAAAAAAATAAWVALALLSSSCNRTDFYGSWKPGRSKLLHGSRLEEHVRRCLATG